ncbi:MAG: hypothetical protein CMJ16_03550 [Peredibacter sp.]|nr:hypothetical protein [Peredibacter sp.]
MPFEKLTRNFLLPELKILDVQKLRYSTFEIKAIKESGFEVCPKCASKSDRVHDRRWVRVKDVPFRKQKIYLIVLKRRFRCPCCKSVFTEPVQGIPKGGRITHRLERKLFWACENYTDLKKVQKNYGVGRKLIYKSFYRQLDLRQREVMNNPWPKTIGIDEHGFSKDKRRGARNFATIIVDHKNKRVREVVEGKSHKSLEEALAYIPGRENVQNVTIDLADSYKSFVKKFFPNARIVADKFHVLRLITPTLNKKRIGITGDRRTHELRKLLLRNRLKLSFEDRIDLDHWLNKHPELKEVYVVKEALHTLYRCKGFNRAKQSLLKLIDKLEGTKLKELKRLRRTLLKWSKEILRYFSMRITNARTEAFNNSAKLVQKRAYGYKSFKNYRLRVLFACQ